MLVAFSAGTSLAACGEDATSVSTGDEVEVKARALIAENWFAQASGRSLSEPYTFTVYGRPSSRWELVTSFNGAAGNEFFYGCSIDGQSSDTTWQFTVGGSQFRTGDTSGFGKGQFSPASPFMAYIAELTTDLSSIRYYYSSDPCPPSGVPSWSIGSFSFPTLKAGSLDYPHSFYGDAFDQGWVAFTGSLSSSNQRTIGVIDVASNSGPGQYTMMTCDNHVNQYPNGVVDSNGDIHFVYNDATFNQVKYVSSIAPRGHSSAPASRT